MNKHVLAAALAAGMVALAGAWWWSQRAHDSAPANTVAVPESEKSVLYWYDPMQPEQHFDQPGKSPFMDMELVPKYAEAGADRGAVTVSSRMAQNLGIRLAKVESSSFSSAIVAAGSVMVDERRIEAVQARVAGWVEKLLVRAESDPVRAGQLLAEIYAPELLSAQEELLLAARARDAALLDGARARLKLLGMATAQIAQIEGSGRAMRTVRYYAPRGGVVAEIGAREGAQIAPGTTLFKIVDLSQVWISAEVPQQQAALLAPGAQATASVGGLAGTSFSGKLDYVYPQLDPATRTVRARFSFANPDQALRPGQFATVTLQGAAHTALSVPSEALIRSGTRSVVIVAAEGGRYRPVDVTAGAESGDRTEIVSGLEEGQSVVASGQFLIDSEANLQGALNRLGNGAPQ